MQHEASTVRRGDHVDYLAPDSTIPTTIGYWSALTATAIGVVYGAVVGFLTAVGKLTLPPPEWVQLFAALVTIGEGPLLVAALAAVHYVVPAERRIFSLLGVLFATTFMVMVSINRFVQLAVVRISVSHGDTSGLARFMPYAPQSAMLALEMVGWGFFLGLALLSTAFAMTGTRIERAVRWTFLVYAVLGIGSTVAFVADSPLSAIGFVAWGLILPIGTGLLAVWFRGKRT